MSTQQPVIHILMIAKSEQLYVATLTEVHRLFPEFNPTTAMCDFESLHGMRLPLFFPTTTVVGCWSHYRNAICDSTESRAL